MERDTVNRVAKAVFMINKDERQELISIRRKLQDMQCLLAKKGMSMAALEKESLLNDAQFNIGSADPTRFISGRDEYGLPFFSNETTGGSGVDTLKSNPKKPVPKGADKFKRCIVGQFTKATLPYRRVKEIANTARKKRGLVLVSQKNDSTFVFKFNSMNEKNTVLSQEGLSRVASVIGVPLGADSLTSQLEILPFAKMCVQYKVGDPLPSSISVVDPDKSNVEVKVTYINKLLFCTHCNSLGHLINVCPTGKREWVRKVPIEPRVHNNTEEANVKDVNAGQTNIAFSSSADMAEDPNNIAPVEVAGDSPLKNKDDDVGWTEVKAKRKPTASHSLSTGSPSPQQFTNSTVDGVPRK
ncbi:hypothetical protein POM88_044772 [Heracleum sosnowskyi]|uniref:DUF4283 domain-containing protein n=1 Tax=Heracleum sosnowskyi TaxID=360622 RepID=A0AAD8H5W2_9APIA|nr:hypothetical protein POM88_044772 [Heracleum sosnowskyi]